MIKQAAKMRQAGWHHTVRSALGFLAAAGFVFCTASLISIHSKAWAQTDFNIRAESADLKSEFQKELDKWMIRAYEGDRDAQFKVGVLFANDQFGPPDNEQSAYWYQQAARQGHILAQYNLGHLFLTGSGVKRDETTAMRWWLKAAEQQHALAQFNVGRAYYLGIGLEKDISQAKLWFERASQNQEPKSTEILKQLGWWDPESVATVAQPASAPQSDAEVIAEVATTKRQTADSALENTTTGLNTALQNIGGVKPNDATLNKSQLATATVGTRQSRESKAMDDVALPAGASQELINETTQQVAKGKPIAVFTNPSVRNVLITIIDDANVLNVEKNEDSWTVVTSTEGFPVWVNKNFIKPSGQMATITADSVNARSVPLITTGSVVGRLNKGEQVSVVAQKGDWFRVTSPQRFQGWVKTKDLVASQNKPTPVNTDLGESSQADNAAPRESEPSTEGESLQATLNKLPYTTNNNEWLFKQDENSYALQLASFSDPTSIQRFLSGLPFRDSNDLHLFTTKTSEGAEWIYVIYGNYNDSDAAKTDSVRLKQKRAWIRRLGVLQQNRCIAWKKELPAPKELNQYCT